MEKVYSLFRNTRLRKEIGARTEFKYIWACYKIWSEENPLLQKLSKEYLKKMIIDEMGKPFPHQGEDIFAGFVVFVSDEDFATHQKLSSGYAS